MRSSVMQPCDICGGKHHSGAMGNAGREKCRKTLDRRTLNCAHTHLERIVSKSMQLDCWCCTDCGMLREIIDVA